MNDVDNLLSWLDSDKNYRNSREAAHTIRQLQDEIAGLRCDLADANETIAVAQRLLECVDLDDESDQADYERVMEWGGEGEQ